MKTRMILVAAALLLMACASFGQGFSVFWYNDLYQLRETSVAGCDAGAPLAEGTVIEIRWDQNGNGNGDPDVDPMAPLCADPPNCTGPVGSVNMNTLAVNGVEQGMGAGYFAANDLFWSVGTVPTPSRFYLVIRCSDGSVHYKSQVYTFAGVPQEADVGTWECTPCSIIQPCHATELVTFVKTVGSNDTTERESACLELCQGSVTIVKICRPAGTVGFDPSKPPVALVRPGCWWPPDCIDDACTPAQFGYSPTGWFIGPDGCWTNTVFGLSDGCVCFTFDHFLAVGFNNDFAAQATDGSVKLTWSTSSEVGMSRFDILRDGAKVGEVVAANAANAYNFVDGNAVNGTTYSYSLRAVNMDGSFSNLGTVEATPSFGAAVVTEYALHQNFPNPFNPTTSITFDVVEKNHVSLKIFNAAGQEVGTVANGEFEAGRHIVTFDAASLPSGLYFYTVKVGNVFSATKKMLLVK